MLSERILLVDDSYSPPSRNGPEERIRLIPGAGDLQGTTYAYADGLIAYSAKVGK